MKELTIKDIAWDTLVICTIIAAVYAVLAELGVCGTL